MKKNIQGFSLVETIVALGIMGVVSLGIMQLTKQQATIQKKTNLANQSQGIRMQISTLLSDEKACGETFVGKNLDNDADMKFSIGTPLKNRDGGSVLIVGSGLNTTGTPDSSVGVYLKSFNLKKYTHLSGDNYEVNMVATIAQENNKDEQKTPIEINFNVYAPGKIIQRCYKMVDGLSKEGQNIKLEGEMADGTTGNIIIGSEGTQITVNPTTKEISLVGTTKVSGTLTLSEDTDLSIGGNFVQTDLNKKALLGNSTLSQLQVSGTTELNSLTAKGPTALDSVSAKSLSVSPGLTSLAAATASSITTNTLTVAPGLATFAAATASSVSTNSLNSSGSTNLASNSGSLTAGNTNSNNTINGTTTFTGDVNISGNHKLTTYSIQNTTVTNNTANSITADFLAVGSGASINTSIPLVVKGESQLDGKSTVTGTFAANGGVMVDGKTVIEDGPGWHNSYDSTGWRNQTYGGGWYMNDTSWLRSWGSKAVFMDTGFDTQAGTTSGIACGGAKGGSNNFNLQVCGSLASNIIYGRTNPGYYLQVDGSSYLPNLTIANGLSVGGGGINTGGLLVYGTQYTGQVVMTNFYANHGYIEWVSYGWGGAWGVSMWASSQKFKKNIKDIEIDTSNLYKLRPVSFDWKDERRGKGRQIGFIAEAVDKYFPELSMKSDKGVMQSVDYGRLTIIIISEMKKLKERVDSLWNGSNELIQLKSEIKNLKIENENMKRDQIVLLEYLCKKDPEASICK